MLGATPPVIGVEQHNCQHAVCLRCLIRRRVSFVPARRAEADVIFAGWSGVRRLKTPGETPAQAGGTG